MIPTMATVEVYVEGRLGPHTFTNAIIGPTIFGNNVVPSIFEVRNGSGDLLALFPAANVTSVLFPDGPSRITSLEV